MKKNIYLALSVLLAVTVIRAGNVRAAEPSSKPLVVASSMITHTLDPVGFESASFMRGIGMAEGLMRITKEGKIIPELAESLTRITPTRWEAKIRKGIKFWSGKSLDTKAVYDSLERTRALNTHAMPIMKALTFTVHDADTLYVDTEAPNPAVPFLLAYFDLMIHNADSYGPQPNLHDLAAMDLTGMFKMVEYKDNEYAVLEANPDYWGEKPITQKIKWMEISDNQARAMALQSGQVDIALKITPESAVTLETYPGVKVVKQPPANTRTIYLNLQRPPFNDINIRQAISWGIDRQAVIDLGVEGLTYPATSWLSSNPAYPETLKHGYTHYNPEKSAQLLDKAGWKLNGKGLRTKDGKILGFTLMSWGSAKPVAEVLQSQWKKIGVDAKVFHVSDYGIISSKRKKGDWDASIEAWSTFGDAAALLAGQFKPNGPANYGKFNNAETVRRFDELSKEMDPDKRREMIIALDRQIIDQTPTIPLHPRPYLTGVRDNVVGFEPHFRQFDRIVTPGLYKK